MQLHPKSFCDWGSLSFLLLLTGLSLHASFRLLVDLIYALAYLSHCDDSLFLLLLLRRLVSTYYCTAIDPADYIKHVVIFLELLERPRALNERSFSIAELPKLIVSPEEKSPVFEPSQGMSLAAAQVI